MELVEIGGQKGILLSEVLYETEVEVIRDFYFDVLGTDGEKITVSGKELTKGILVPRDDGSAGVVWAHETGYPSIEKLLRIRWRGRNASSAVKSRMSSNSGWSLRSTKTDPSTPILGSSKAQQIHLKSPVMELLISYFSLNDLRSLAALSTKKTALSGTVFSVVTTGPQKSPVAKGAD